MLRTLILIGALVVAACAPSPLYVGAQKPAMTNGNIPRDGRGEPVWSAIPPPAPQTSMRPMPADAGVPVTPPPR